MEFETNDEPSNEAVALAQAPKVMLQPIHSIEAAPMSAQHDPAVERTFDFERETTTAMTAVPAHDDTTNHKTALAVAALCALVFVAILLILFIAR